MDAARLRRAPYLCVAAATAGSVSLSGCGTTSTTDQARPGGTVSGTPTTTCYGNCRC